MSWSSGTLEQIPVGIRCYTDGSKLGDKVGLGFYIEDPKTEIYHRLPNHNTSFQAEVRAITECVNWVSINVAPTGLNIFTDSQKAICAISGDRIKSKTVLDCKKALPEYSQRGKIYIIWVPGHSGAVGNERANVKALKGRELDVVNLTNAKPFDATKAELKIWIRESHKASGNNETVVRTTKILWGDPDECKTRNLLKMSKSETSEEEHALQAVSQPKTKRQKQFETRIVNKPYSEVAIVDKSVNDGSFSQDKSVIIRQKMLEMYWKILEENSDPSPQNYDACWHQGHIKLLAFLE
ncbi:hypothetical protein FF38_03161 [Lucilia cuprina]|uniref:RNase H type-1 domain-containing protein n=1 Tax=Lucilia cuprina TaxID=7375 RepID=A0A0L0CHN6_LUCCU|nr:hypothetical protein FF38_03161 [Lucilia cuprina]